ncbi:MAG: LCP family protein [Minisyncoccia bacterium]
MSKKLFFSILFIILGVLSLLFILWYGYSKPNILEFSRNNNFTLIPRKTSINILFLGVPGSGYEGSYLTDTIFIVNLNPNNNTVTLISIPRDLWIRVPNTNYKLKINALFAYDNPKLKELNEAKNFQSIKTKISEITGLNIDYVTVFDLDGLKILIDQIGGINVWLDKTILDPRFTNPYDPNDIFNLPPGWHTLDGKTSIKFVRTRYNPQGDFYRINNQHLIIGAIKDKLIDLSKVWSITDWFKLWQSLSNHYITNIDFPTLWNIISNFKNANIKYLTLSNREPDNLLISTSTEEYYNNATTSVYILIPKQGFENYEEIKNYLNKNLNQ